MTKRLFMLTGVSTVLFGIFVLAQHYTNQRLLAQSNVPYTLVRDLYSGASVDSQMPIKRVTIAVRSDRARCTVSTANGDTESTRRLDLPNAKYAFMIEPLKIMYSGYSSRTRSAMLLRTNPIQARCILSKEEQAVGEETVLNRRVMRLTRTDLKNTGNSLRLTQWRDPGLACEVLKSVLEELQPDGTVSSVTQDLAVSLTIGEPDSRLFEVPPDYKEVLPSEAARRWAEYKNVPLTDPARLAVRDSQYQQSQTPPQ